MHLVFPSFPAYADCPQVGQFGLVAPRSGESISLESEFRFLFEIFQGSILTLESPGLGSIAVTSVAGSDFVFQVSSPMSSGVSYNLYHSQVDCLEECRELLGSFVVSEEVTDQDPPLPMIEYAGDPRTPDERFCHDKFPNRGDSAPSEEDRWIEVRLIRPESQVEFLRPVIQLRWRDSELEIDRVETYRPPSGETTEGFGALLRFPQPTNVNEIEMQVHFMDLAGQKGPVATQTIELTAFPFACSGNGLGIKTRSQSWFAWALWIAWAGLLFVRKSSRTKCVNDYADL